MEPGSPMARLKAKFYEGEPASVRDGGNSQGCCHRSLGSTPG